MKHLLALLVLVFSCSAWAGRPLSGFIVKEEGKTYILVSEKNRRYEVAKSSSTSSLNNISKLSSGDFIFGNGNLNDQTESVEVDGIDYVGLKKLIGAWVSQEGVFYFKNFTDLLLYTVSKNTALRSDLRYSTAPAAGDQWVLFISDKKATTLATIELSSSQATMQLFDSETGAVVKTLNLKRWGN